MRERNHDLLFPDVEQLAQWPTPDVNAMSTDYKGVYEIRAAALQAVITGTSICQAAKHFQMNRTTLTKTCRLAVELHSDGRPWGFRACLPFSKKDVPFAPDIKLPAASAPHAFSKVLANFPDLKAKVEKFSGPLPSRGKRSPAFNRLYSLLKKDLSDAGLSHLYPLNTQTQGRRALITYIQSRRKVVIDAGGGSGTEEAPSLSRLDQIMNLLPLERIEFDAHRVDIEGTMQIQNAKGEIVSRPVGTIWLLAIIDVATRVILAWMLVYGPSYKRFPVLRMFAKALTPWSPRSLTVANLHYKPNAWMPSQINSNGVLRRAMTFAMDNARAHHAGITMDNTHAFQLGVVNLGPAHIAQSRPYIEAFFKTEETQVLRYVAGGFEPAHERGENAKPIATKKAERHPIDPIALEDLMDVMVANYNITPHSGLQDRTPREAFESYFEANGWYFASTRTAEDAEKLTEIRTYVTIRGYRRDGKPPAVRWKGARYRSSLIINRWDLVGTRYLAVIRFDDARKMRLFDPKTGELFVTLDALPPWHCTAHTVEVRERPDLFEEGRHASRKSR